MSFEFATVGSELEAYLKSKVPTAWKVQDIFKPLPRGTSITLTYLQGNASVRSGSNVVAHGHVMVEFVLTLTAPEKDPVKGFARLNTEVHHLFNALDANSQLDWEQAEAAVVGTGESVYLFNIQVLAAYDTNQE